MSRIPPSLLCLTIYNPTLRPAGPVDDDDEDAEEQAHILFYTSKERAVSRDRMLRQVGLAKALVNFSSMFNGADPCNNVHSQSKRMIMVSPEPDFWIHAAVEVAKVPRAPPEKSKGKSREKPKSREKGKESVKESTESAPLFDYQEGSVHDLALRADILRGYEQFKLTHGSFTSILAALGQEALELQLERFFTVWAWTWDLEDGAEFRDHLGISLHPSFRTLGPVLDSYSQQLPDRTSCIFIQPPCVVPSSQYSASKYPTALPRHLLSCIPPTPPPSHNPPHDVAIKGTHHTGVDVPNGKDPPKSAQVPSGSTFLGMPTMTVGVSKWSWPGYLTFGKGGGKRQALEMPEESEKAAATEAVKAQVTPAKAAEAIGLDQSALEDAISENVSIAPSSTSHGDPAEPAGPLNAADIGPSPVPQPIDTVVASEGALDPVESQISHLRDPADAGPDTTSLASLASAIPPAEASLPPPEALPRAEFSFVTVHLADPGNALLTTRQKVYYIVHDRSMLALVGLDDDLATSAPDLAQGALALLDEIDTLLTAELSKTITADQLPTASKILQPTDTHVIAASGFTLSNTDFASKSGYLFDAQELQTRDSDIFEVFSRGLNPQHWHVARRGLRVSLDDRDRGEAQADDGEVYMQVFRKEASFPSFIAFYLGIFHVNVNESAIPITRGVR
ncbi:putative fungal domain of unknown function (DUF1712) [Lyophyllum shimeji]|uniref:CCZ1/INTU/HSP4 first Longin domain-containing protein n=1 Tax=Lyophyllum shimeji TaxID=47721 RepID=A0A9P3UTB1_LYOSH|nr:putative fungal domain of unknown function (DUF1712) [Lyophyllum shimeji]